MAKFPPLFKRVYIDPAKEGHLIAEIQQDFEQFWRTINKKVAPNREKSKALAKMQESCMWLTRSIAISGFVPDEPTPFIAQSTPIIENNFEPLCKVDATYAPPIERSLIPAPSMCVLVKKKRQFASVITPNVED